jgi:hypothetical protein
MKLSIIQNIALFFYKTIDKNGFLYLALNSLHKYLRWTFYIGLVLSLYLFLNFIGGFILLENYHISANTVNLLNFLGILTINLSTIYSSLIITYESIYNLNMQEVLIAQKKRKEFIKLNKLQWWRLRNMPFIFRALFYIVTYGFIYMILSFSAVAAMLDTTTLNAQNINLFFQEFESMIQIYSLVYVIVAITFDYFVSKNRDIQKALK